jgi:hypothetical protein
MSPDHIEAARLLRPVRGWERRFHHYDLLTIAGVPADEAERIVSEAAADRMAEHKPQEIAA